MIQGEEVSVASQVGNRKQTNQVMGTGKTNRDAAQAPPFRSERETRGYPAGRAIVQFDPSEITPEKLVEAVNSTGYKASLLRSGGS